MRPIVLLVAAVCLLAGGTSRSDNHSDVEAFLTPEQKLAVEFQTAIEDVGKRHHLTPEQSMQALFHAVGNETPLFSHGKGGVSPIRRHLYVLNDPAPNTVVAGGNRWVSGRGNARELVVVSGGSRITSVPIAADDLGDDLIFILFDGRRIRYYDWTSLRGATVYRETASSGTKGR